MSGKGLIVVISGFSGAGKGTIVSDFMNKHPECLLSISATTREPRTGEIDGVHYHFLNKNDFLDGIEKDDFIEYNEYQGNYYGTPKSFVAENSGRGTNVILEIDVNGGEKIKECFPDALRIFVAAPSARILAERLRSRGTDSPEKIRGRLLRAVEETAFIKNYDYLLINDSLDDSVRSLELILDREMNSDNDASALPETVFDIPSSGKAVDEFIKCFENELSKITKGE